MQSNPSNLFVYGLLMSGFDNEAASTLHRASEIVQPARIRGILYDLGSYPAAVYSPSHTDYIHGEIIRIKPDLLTDILGLLDRFEGIDPLSLSGPEYMRSVIPIEVDTATEHAWCYLYNGNSTAHKVILSGNYRTR